MAPVPEIAIAGIGLTEQARSLDSTSMEVSLEAAKLALDDAGMDKDDVDGIAARWTGPGGTIFEPGSADWAGLMGIEVSWIGDSYPQGIPAVLDAAAAIRSGYCHTVLITGGQAGVMKAEGGKVASYTRPANEFTEPWGSFTSAHFALVAQRYLHRFPEARGVMAEVAATIRNIGARNPEAVMFGKGPYTAESVLASPPVVDPFKLFDLCLANEGAAALVVTTLERARNCPNPPVRVMGGGMEWKRQQYVDPPRYEDVWNIGADAAARAFGMSGLSREDVDLFEFYDVNSYEVLRQFEALGFCGEGEAAGMITERGIGLDGELPTCTDGGTLSFSHIGWGAPTLKVIEGTRQLRGASGELQVKDAEVALCAGAGAGAQYYNVLLLAQDR